MIIALSLVVGVTDALSMPSFQSIVPSIVARDEIGRGLALNSTQFNLSRILGPAIAGVLMASVGAVACFAAQRGVLHSVHRRRAVDSSAPSQGASFAARRSTEGVYCPVCVRSRARRTFVGPS